MAIFIIFAPTVWKGSVPVLKCVRSHGYNENIKV